MRSLRWLACRNAVLCGELPAGNGKDHARELMALKAASFAFGPLPPRLMILESRVQPLADRIRLLIQHDPPHLRGAGQAVCH